MVVVEATNFSGRDLPLICQRLRRELKRLDVLPYDCFEPGIGLSEARRHVNSASIESRYGGRFLGDVPMVYHS